MVRLYVKDNVTGIVHEYGKNQHDSLNLSEDGSLHYLNLQNGTGTMFPEQGYSFCDKNGNTDFYCPETGEAIYDIGGEFFVKAEQLKSEYDFLVQALKRIGQANLFLYDSGRSIDLEVEDKDFFEESKKTVHFNFSKDGMLKSVTTY